MITSNERSSTIKLGSAASRTNPEARWYHAVFVFLGSVPPVVYALFGYPVSNYLYGIGLFGFTLLLLLPALAGSLVTAAVITRLVLGDFSRTTIRTLLWTASLMYYAMPVIAFFNVMTVGLSLELQYPSNWLEEYTEQEALTRAHYLVILFQFIGMMCGFPLSFGMASVARAYVPAECPHNYAADGSNCDARDLLTGSSSMDDRAKEPA